LSNIWILLPECCADIPRTVAKCSLKTRLFDKTFLGNDSSGQRERVSAWVRQHRLAGSPAGPIMRCIELLCRLSPSL